MDMKTFTKYLVTPVKKWSYQTKNFGTFLSSDESIPYAPSWRIRRTLSEWPMVEDVPSDQKIRLVGTLHDLTLGPYWSGHSEANDGIGPTDNYMAARAKAIHFAANGQTTAAHAVGMFLRQAFYKEIHAPWVNQFIRQEDKKFIQNKILNAPSYYFDGTVNCTTNNEHDALLGDYCNVVVYDSVATTSPFVTPGKQNLYIATPNISIFSQAMKERTNRLRNSMVMFKNVMGGLPKTDVTISMASTNIDGGLSGFKPELIANHKKVGTAPPAILGPLTSYGRTKLKIAR